MPDHILYTYKAPKQRELSEEEVARGINPPLPPHHPGVPLRDLTADDIEGMPVWLQETVAASDLYGETAEGKKWRKAREIEQEPAAVTSPRHAPKPEKEA